MSEDHGVKRVIDRTLECLHTFFELDGYNLTGLSYAEQNGVFAGMARTHANAPAHSSNVNHPLELSRNPLEFPKRTSSLKPSRRSASFDASGVGASAGGMAARSSEHVFDAFDVRVDAP